MSSQRYTPELKDEAGRRVLEQCYISPSKSQRLDVSADSL